MSNKDDSGFFMRFLSGLWRFVDRSRQVVVNILFLFIMMILLVAIFADDAILIDNKTSLVLAPKGVIVDQYSREPVDVALDRAFDREVPETQLRDLLRVIEAAATDDRIANLVILPDYIWDIGPANLAELAGAIDRFRESGKPVIGLSDGMAQHQYYLAALADEVWLNPEGVVFLEGYGRYRNYYADGLDKLGVKVNLFRVGEYKSAAEPYIRNSMSDESREANRYWLSDLWDAYTAEIERRRELEPGAVHAFVSAFEEHLREAGGDLAVVALNAGLVDKLKTRDQMRAAMIELGAADTDNDTFRQIDHETYLAAVGPGSAKADRVAVIVAQGPIVNGEQPPGAIGGESTARLIEQARHHKGTKAIVLRVNSPGGAVFPSERIRRAVEVTRASGKPVVVSMGDVAASGGYWISMSADAIVANPTTITGSIGIFGMLLTFPETLGKIGIYTDGVGTTPLAGAFRPDRDLSPQASDIIQQIIDRGYQRFIGQVAQAREMSVDAVDEVARGRVWSGQQAFDRGLVDRIGTLHDAIEHAAELADIDDYSIKWVEREVTPFEQFLLDATASVMTWAGVSDHLFGGLTLWPGMRQAADELRLLLEDYDVNTMYAHCLCSIGGR